MTGFKKKYFPKGYRRFLSNTLNKMIHRTSLRDFTRAFERLEIPAGAVICVHGALSGFGYIPEGPTAPLNALRNTVKDCTLIMPSFPFSGTPIKYLEKDPVFDYNNTPSASGLLSEVFRRMPGTLRSPHPTHPCTALGPRALELIDGSEQAQTPFGNDSTFGRFSELHGEAYIVLLHTNSISYAHRLTEIVQWPNLFIEQQGQARTIVPDGTIQTFSVAVYRSWLPHYIAVGSDDDGRVEYLFFPDYLVQFPSSRQDHVNKKLKSKKAREFINTRQEQFLRSGILKIAKCGDGEIMLVNVGPWTDAVVADIRRNFQEFPDAYQLEVLERANQEGRLTR